VPMIRLMQERQTTPCVLSASSRLSIFAGGRALQSRWQTAVAAEVTPP
jgi:hypothetical protein